MSLQHGESTIEKGGVAKKDLTPEFSYTEENPIMSYNRYLYVNNNPYKYVDPNGEFLQLAGAIIGAGLEAYSQYSKSGKITSWTKVAISGAAGAVGGGIVNHVRNVVRVEAGLTGTSAAAATVGLNSGFGAALGFTKSPLLVK